MIAFLRALLLFSLSSLLFLLSCFVVALVGIGVVVVAVVVVVVVVVIVWAHASVAVVVLALFLFCLLLLLVLALAWVSLTFAPPGNPWAARVEGPPWTSWYDCLSFVVGDNDHYNNNGHNCCLYNQQQL